MTPFVFLLIALQWILCQFQQNRLMLTHLQPNLSDLLGQLPDRWLNLIIPTKSSGFLNIILGIIMSRTNSRVAILPIMSGHGCIQVVVDILSFVTRRQRMHRFPWSILWVVLVGTDHFIYLFSALTIIILIHHYFYMFWGSSYNIMWRYIRWGIIILYCWTYSLSFL